MINDTVYLLTPHGNYSESLRKFEDKLLRIFIAKENSKAFQIFRKRYKRAFRFIAFIQWTRHG